jgi:pyruvate kinase
MSAVSLFSKTHVAIIEKISMIVYSVTKNNVYMAPNKKTKIVATIGPVTSSEEMLAKLLEAGFNVMRLNFSHGDFAEHQAKVDNLKKAIKKTGIPAAVMQDLSGPKFRLGDFYQERVQLKAGDYIILTTDKITGDEKRVSVNYPTLHEEILPGNIIMVDDGKKKFEVVEIKGHEIKCKIIVGGDTKGRRSLNLPGAPLKISALTEKDKEDLEFGIKNNVDIVAFSFVRKPSDVVELREILNKKKSKAKIMAKIETVEAVEHFDEILELVDMVMVARGDLAVELGHENVPTAQKMMIEKCLEAGKPVVTATQMLESMIKSPVPTRAEVSDIANAIFDGTDAVMLSEETTLGEFPVEAVEVMSRVALKVENDPMYLERMIERNIIKHPSSDNRTADAITNEVVDIATTLKAKVIFAFTESGFTARMIARYRPQQPVIAITPNELTFTQLLVSFGVTPVTIESTTMLNDVLKFTRTYCSDYKLAKKGDKVVIALGMPFGKNVDTNMLLVETI